MKKKLTDKPTIEYTVIVMMELEESEIADEFTDVITVYGRDGNALADLEDLEERLGK